MTLAQNIKDIKEEISQLNPAVKLVVVSKYADLEQLKEAYDSGIRVFGENYVLPAIEKIESLKEHFQDPVEWHLLGHLQKNKAKKAVQYFDLIQSVDSLELARVLDKEAAKINKKQKVFIQINTTAEEKKSGFEPEDFVKAIASLKELSNIQVMGLMGMGPTPSDLDNQLNETEKKEKLEKNMGSIFGKLRHIVEEMLRQKLIDAKPEISFGMSDDYFTAIQNGSTMIRVGRKIFE